MEIDKTTLYDLSVFNTEEEYSIFHTLDRTRTIGGRHKLKHIFSHSLGSVEEIINMQDTLKLIQMKKELWPVGITNGTIMVVHKFYEHIIDQIPSNPSPTSTYLYKWLHAPDFSLVKYSITHCFDLIKGMDKLVQNFLKDDTPNPLKKVLANIQNAVNKEQLKSILKKEKFEDLTRTELLSLANFIRYHY